ncbi:hypothetical protein [Streptacidiphilus sp. P02-A3a]|uniref:hypothetical protein n=1 Tax=Streptacidiphilus sp. P02-A3a TaxID=2704468 RepID=UPI0015F806B6|nr:hypothetical protein [Streptacidiphilus sp. P02-A3a]QMU71373.1 hypothetical protein GXP74_27225 [Streptacidiphilus sp. P02-A3a]
MVTRRTILGSSAAASAAALLVGAPGAANANPSATATAAPTPTATASAPTAAGAAQVLRAQAAIRAVDTAMQQNYDTLKADLTTHLSPVVVVFNDAQGGLYTLVVNGQQQAVHPAGVVFEMAKAIAHTPLGIYTVIAPYLSNQVPAWHSTDIDPHDLAMVAFDGPGTDWIPPLQAFSATLATARQQLAAAQLPPDLQTSCANIIDGAQQFIAQATRSQYVDMKSFETYTGSVYEDIRTNMYYASQAQIDGVTALMNQWRAQLGPTAWSELYVVVLEMWTTSVKNQNSIIIRNLMDPAQVDSHLIDLSTAETPADPVATALDNLARIVQDNIAAEMVFCTDQTLADALKGTEDLLSEEILQLLGGTGGTPSPTATAATTATAAVAAATQGVCPYQGRAARA